MLSPDNVSNRVVMLLSNAFRPDTRVLKEAQSLQTSGYDVTILCWDRERDFAPEEILPSGVRVIRIQSVRSNYGIGFRQLLRLPRFWLAIIPLLNRLKPDLVHCHDFDTLPAGLIWGRLNNRPVIYDAHEYYAELVRPRLRGLGGRFIYHTIRYIERFAARLASGVITVDEILGAIYRKLNSRVIIVGHYPTLQGFQTPSQIFSSDQLTLIYVGRLSADRGLFTYLEVLQHLRGKGIPARLILAGTFTPAGEGETFWHSSKGQDGNIDWLGWITYDQIPDLLRKADVGLVILKSEPRYVAALPVKLFEYMAAGLPVVASNFPATASVVQAVNCGALVDPETDPALIAEIIQGWWSNPEIPRMIGYRGFQAARQTYNWDNIARQIVHLYQAVLS